MRRRFTRSSLHEGRGLLLPSLLGIAVTIALLVNGAHAWAFSPYLTAWEGKYPNSTLPTRMETETGSHCNLCHQPPSTSTLGNCYREDLAQLLGGGLNIDQALDAADTLDSDGDGAKNGGEINTSRTDLPGEVGYSPGLVGSTGTDPCGPSPSTPVTNVPETPLVRSEETTWGRIKTLYQ